MCSEHKNTWNLVGFFPDEARGLVNTMDEINNPLVERSIFDGEKSEGNAKENWEQNQGSLKNKKEVATIEKNGEEQPRR